MVTVDFVAIFFVLYCLRTSSGEKELQSSKSLLLFHKKIQCKFKGYAQHMDMRIFSRFWFNTFVPTHKNYIVCYWQICQKCISTLELIHITCWARVSARMHIKTLAKFQFPKNLRSFSINDFEIVLFNETHKNQNVNKPSQSTFTIKKYF